MPQRDLGREGAGAGPGEGRLAKESAPSVEDVERDRRRLGHGEVEREQASACEVRSPHDGGEVVDRDGRWRVPDHEGRGRRGVGGGRGRGRRGGSSRRRAARRRAGARGRRTRGGRRGGRRPGGRRRRGGGRRGGRRRGGARRGGRRLGGAGRGGGGGGRGGRGRARRGAGARGRRAGGARRGGRWSGRGGRRRRGRRGGRRRERVGRGDRVEAAEAARLVEAGRADVDGAARERGLHLRGRQRRVLVEEQRGDARRVRRGRRRSEERAEGRAQRKPAGVRDRDPVERDEIGLGANLRRGEIDTGGTMRAERLDGVEGGIVHVDGADGDDRRQRRMPDDAAGGSAVLERSRAEAEELEVTRRPRGPIDQDVGELVGVR